MRRIFLIATVLLFFLFAFPIQKAFAECNFLIQSEYTSDDSISVTATNLMPQLLYSLSVTNIPNPYDSDIHYVNSTSSVFNVGKLTASINPYMLWLTGKDSRSLIKDSCLGKTSDGIKLFTVSLSSGQTVDPRATRWELNGDTPRKCVQTKSGSERGTFNTEDECKSAISLNASKTEDFPNIPPPCAKWVFAFPADHPEASRLNNIEIPPNDPSYTLNDKIEFGKCAVVDTAIGKIDIDPAGFVKRIFSFVLGIAGGIALILIIISGYRLMASQGNPEAVKAATEQVTSAIVGLLFIIFAFVILQIIGVDILRIPGFKP